MTTTTINTPDVTRTCQNPVESSSAFTSAGLVAALERAWAAIRDRHPDVPAAVLVVGSGTENRQTKWGHFAAMRWQHGTTALPEVLVSGEGLKRPVAEVLTTLLHEAAHGLAHTRNITDTSRQGRWHNKKFASLATELGLDPEKDTKLGWSHCTLRTETAATYRPVLDELTAALSAWRHPEPERQNGRTSSNNGSACVCECPRKIRVAASTLEEGPIVCGVCDTAFLTENTDRDAADTAAAAHLVRYAAKILPPVPSPAPSTPDTSSGGIPSYRYRMAPDGLATVRQLRAMGLRPGGQQPCAEIVWRRGRRIAYLYDTTKALPKRQATPAQLAAIGKALTARRTCPTCTQVKPYYIPTRYGECFDCAPECRKWGAA